MTQNELANSGTLFKGQKGCYRLEIQLNNNQKQGIFIVNILNVQTNISYSLGLDRVEISKDKTLGGIFRTPQELYEELVSGFEEVVVEEFQGSLIIKYQVKVGKFRRELITLQAKKLSQKGAQPLKTISSSPPNSKKKVYVDKKYAKDLGTFKEDFNKICDKIANKELLTKLNINNDRNNRIKIKNVFIAFANTLLRSYRKCVQYIEVQPTEEEYATQPPNQLLVQKNELLENILFKAIKRIRETPTQQIEIDFMPQIPTQMIVVTEDKREVPLDKYLTPFPLDQIQKKIRFYERRQEKIANFLNILHQKKKQRVEQLSSLFEGERRGSRKSLNGKKANLDTLESDQFDGF